MVLLFFVCTHYKFYFTIEMTTMSNIEIIIFFPLFVLKLRWQVTIGMGR